MILDDLNEQEIRSIHIIYRAMDDGVCPYCGKSGVKKFYCWACGFILTPNEIKIIEAEINPRALKKRMDEFTRLREVLK